MVYVCLTLHQKCLILHQISFLPVPGSALKGEIACWSTIVEHTDEDARKHVKGTDMVPCLSYAFLRPRLCAAVVPQGAIPTSPHCNTTT